MAGEVMNALVAPCDFQLFDLLKTHLSDKRFPDEEAETEAWKWLRQQ
jgi:hypothetical protein